MSARRIFIAAVITACSLVTACSGGASDATAALPSGAELVKKSAEATRAVKSATFSMETEGAPPVPVKKASGRLSGTGDADGTIQIDVAGSLQEISFVLIGETVHFKGVTGGFQKMSRSQLAAIYDPSAILNPEKGVVQLLSNALDPKTQAAEKVNGADAYRVSATLSQQVLATMVPGLAQSVDGTLWIDKATSHLLKADLPLTGGKVIVLFGDYDVPVQVTAPAQ
ncbi:LppX_LprAFG lipoprotein [Streptosporangium sp. NBC_01755]|uniref:LppX_LprAFG lipoprotein n=1 Tax=unclassified Streptosporangium TaxID=2632669 RepID=UPI002DD8D31C|nr:MULTISPECIES: LppX_LprAFG lipoprotein [unclassified Streptosporangium]WSA29455.1 LppX_LprAFG lipoprotein [Streptosporangium sp. NBC_01810]WSC99125.1 LppX_LprAFG lipoprotein [Streptosporangium sp. NBC_01755]